MQKHNHVKDSVPSNSKKIPPNPHLKEIQSLPFYKETGFSIDFPRIADKKTLTTIFKRKNTFAEKDITMRHWFNKKEKKMISLAHFSDSCEGPIGCVHGGAIATCLDSALGWFTCILVGFSAVTLTLDLEYKNFVPLDAVVVIECNLVKQENQKWFVTASMRDASVNGKVSRVMHSKAAGLFYKTDSNFPSFELTKSLFQLDLPLERIVGLLYKQKSKL